MASPDATAYPHNQLAIELTIPSYRIGMAASMDECNVPNCRPCREADRAILAH